MLRHPANMSAPAKMCEVKTDDGWQIVSLSDARSHHTMARKRCPGCHGEIAILGTYTAPPKLSLSHRKSHNGCQYSMSRRYSGSPSMHPQALA